MKNRENQKNENLTRKKFLGFSAAALMTTPSLFSACSKEKPRRAPGQKGDPSAWWEKGGYIIHDSVDASSSEDGEITAFIEGSWQKLKIVKLPERFINWSLSERAERLKRLAAYGFSSRDLAGPHNACIATYGGPSRDSSISLNTAYKGMGFAPRKDKLSGTVSMLRESKERIEKNSAGDFRKMMLEKTQQLGRLYSDKGLFDNTKQVSLELFTDKDYHTHTFLNMMSNPIASASFLAFPTFEIRAVPQLLHPANPELTEYERGLISYTSAIHNFIHGGGMMHITCVYHVIEVFDDTPNDSARGRRLA